MTTIERPVNSRELREHFDIGEATMHRWIAAGCPHMRSRHGQRTRLYFHIPEVEAWLRPTEEKAA